MHKETHAVTGGGDRVTELCSPVSPASGHSQSHLELDQLLAIVELFANAHSLTKDQQDEIQSLSSWIHGWQLQEADGLQPCVLQFIRECACDCLHRSQGGVPILTLIRSEFARLSLH